MWFLSLVFLGTLWAIAFTIWALWQWKPPDEKVRRPMQSPSSKL